MSLIKVIRFYYHPRPSSKQRNVPKVEYGAKQVCLNQVQGGFNGESPDCMIQNFVQVAGTSSIGLKFTVANCKGSSYFDTTKDLDHLNKSKQIKHSFKSC